MTVRQVVVGEDGRAKAYRPLPEGDRVAAVVAGLEAYGAGDFFEAHELMEPAWMGTADLAERNLIQGLIKVAAADVHGVRGNPAGIRRNLEGARDRLRSGAGGSITGHRSRHRVAHRPRSRHGCAVRPSSARRSRSDGGDDEHGIRHGVDRRHGGGAPPARGPGRATARRRPRTARVRRGARAGRRARADVDVCDADRGTTGGPAADDRLPQRQPLGGSDRIPGAFGAHGRRQCHRRHGRVGARRASP